MAPEVLTGEVSPASDMWSIGVIAYALLCGHLPFEGDTLEATRSRVAKGQARFPASWWRGVSAPAVDFVKRLLVVGPGGRLTGEAALCHPWLELAHAANPAAMLPDEGRKGGLLHRRLSSFHRFGALKRMALLCIAIHMGDSASGDLTKLRYNAPQPQRRTTQCGVTQ